MHHCVDISLNTNWPYFCVSVSTVMMLRAGWLCS